MAKITINTDLENVNKIIISELEKHKQVYDDSSIILKNNKNEQLIYNYVEIVDETTINLVLSKSVVLETLLIEFNLLSYDDKVIGFFEIYKPEVIKKGVIEETIKLSTTSNAIKISSDIDITNSTINKLIVKKFVVEKFPDFSETEEEIELVYDENSVMFKQYEYIFERNFLYSVCFYHGETEVKSEFIFNPQYYFSNIEDINLYLLEQDVGVIVDKLKLQTMIYKESKKATALAQINISQIDIEKDNEIALFNEYVVKKICAGLLSVKILSENINGDEGLKVFSDSSVVVGSFERGAAKVENYYNTMVNLIKTINNEIKLLEENIKESYKYFQVGAKDFIKNKKINMDNI